VVDLAPNQEYCVSFEIDHQDEVAAAWPLEASACFSTEVPCGVSFDIGVKVQVRELGSDVKAANLMNALLAASSDTYPIILMYPDTPPGVTFPYSNFWLAMGSYNYGVDGAQATLDEKGLSTTMDGCTIGSTGTFNCGPGDVLFPFDIDGGRVQINVLNASMTASAVSSGNLYDLNSYVLTGVVSEEELEAAAEEMGHPELMNFVKLNRDLDGDGTNDAATFKIASSPNPLTIAGCIP